ncbi:MAG: ABC transporter ATP-binding protein [Planctomycetota bacterium]
MSGSVHEETVAGRIFDWQVYRRLGPFARPYLLRFAASVFLLFVLAGASLLTPLALKFAFDRILLVRTSEGSPDPGWADAAIARFAETDAGRLGAIAILLAAAGIITFAARLAQIWLANDTGQRIVYDLREHVFRHLQERNLRFFDTNPVGRLVTRVTSDVEALAELFTAGIDIICYDLVMIGITLGILFWLDPVLAGLVLLGLPFVGAWSFVFKREAQQLFRAVRGQVTRLNSFINEAVTGIRVIQTFRTEERTKARFFAWNEDLRRAHVATVRNFSLFYPGVEVFSAAGAAVILVAGFYRHESGAITVGTMLAFWFLLHKFFEPLRQISEKYNVLQSAMASAERLLRVLDDDREIPEPAAPAPLDLSGRDWAIEFDRVRFAYDGETEVLRDLSFRVRAGEKIAIVGHTGAGKSSIINLLARFYDVSGGAVRLAGRDIREYRKSELRRSVGVVLQDVFLFADTVRENLRLGEERFDDERLREACRTVLADRFVDALPGGLDHAVRERGASFSAGEKQLLAFARTIAHDPPILVLDEATANVDTQTEVLIQRALDRLMEDRTVIVIAHRLSTIRKADRIIVMHHGELREIGTHAELLAQDGLYRRLYELQYRGQEATRADGERKEGQGA